MKKKQLSIFLFTLFAIFYGITRGNYCKAINSYYNLTGENLKRIYLFGKQQSIDNFPTERSDYNSLLIQWEHWDTFSGDINWDLMASNFNDYIYNSSSGDNNPTRTYSDDNLICFCMPGNYLDNSTDRPLVFMFIQYNTRMIKLTESYSNNTYNETMSIVNISGDAVNYALPYKYYYIKVFSNRVDYGNSTNDSSLDYNFLSYYRGKFSNYINLNEMYAYGLLNLYRTDTIGDGYKWIYYKPYNANDVSLYRMYYQMNLDLNEVYAGDIPTPTPEPTEEPNEETGGMTSGEFIASQEEYWGNDNDINNFSGEQIIENGVNEIIGKVSGEILSGDTVGMLDYLEDGIKALFNQQAHDFKITWGTGYTVDVNTGVYYPMIQSGEINFSQIERDSEDFSKLMQYLRIILNFAVITALIKSAWNLLMDYLGVQEAKEQIGDVSIAEATVETVRTRRE